MSHVCVLRITFAKPNVSGIASEIQNGNTVIFIKVHLETKTYERTKAGVSVL